MADSIDNTGQPARKSAIDSPSELSGLMKALRDFPKPTDSLARALAQQSAAARSLSELSGSMKALRDFPKPTDSLARILAQQSAAARSLSELSGSMKALRDFPKPTDSLARALAQQSAAARPLSELSGLMKALRDFRKPAESLARILAQQSAAAPTYRQIEQQREIHAFRHGLLRPSTRRFRSFQSSKTMRTKRMHLSTRSSKWELQPRISTARPRTVGTRQAWLPSYFRFYYSFFSSPTLNSIVRLGMRLPWRMQSNPSARLSMPKWNELLTR